MLFHRYYAIAIMLLFFIICFCHIIDAAATRRACFIYATPFSRCLLLFIFTFACQNSLLFLCLLLFSCHCRRYAPRRAPGFHAITPR